MRVPKFPPRPVESVSAPVMIVSTLPDELPWTVGGRQEDTPPPVEPPVTLATVEAPTEAPAAERARPRWLLPVAGVVVAAIVAGLIVWLTAGSDDPPPVTPSKPDGVYLFQRMGETIEPMRDSNCAAHAYGKVRQFLVQNQCRQLSRAVYISNADDGRVVYTNIGVVRMPSRELAEQLELLVRQDGTGSVNDLIREGLVRAPGLDRLSLGGFAAASDGQNVVIAESDTTDKDPDPAVHQKEMKDISVDALRLGKDLD
ncbi:hypothetical protein [Actinokineospora enzanensis]|uniref:hypothetical protein n=1 Tax=Actinokineospora enzanensis TaxID=155975 RepID=UPI00036B3583|nr:hypothetical protein [Actinokineospora enzanensis]